MVRCDPFTGLIRTKFKL